MILVVDNYDSFTFNLVQALQAAGADVRVVRNDAIDRAGVEALADDPEAHLRGIVISPGPGDPDDAGVSVDTIEVAAEREIPLLGVCLGMQSMAAAYGATIVRAPTLVHGEASEVTHDGAGLLEGMPPSFMAARYHSLAIDPGDAAAGAAGDRDERGRPGDHGHPPRRPADGGRPVPPRERADARRARTCSRTSCARPGKARRRSLDDATGSFATAGLAGEAAPMSDHVRAALATIVEGGTLTLDEARLAMGAVMDGEATPAQLAALLMGLRMRGETVDELAGFATAMRERVVARGGARGHGRRRRHRRRRERHVQHLDGFRAGRRRRRRARSPSTAIGRSRRRRARPTSSMRSASGSTTTRRPPAPRCASSGSPSCSPRTSTRRCATPARPARRSGCARRSTCSARSPTRPARAGSCSASATRRAAGRFAEVVHRLGTERTLVVHGAGVDELPLDGTGVSTT